MIRTAMMKKKKKLLKKLKNLKNNLPDKIAVYQAKRKNQNSAKALINSSLCNHLHKISSVNGEIRAKLLNWLYLLQKALYLFLLVPL